MLVWDDGVCKGGFLNSMSSPLPLLSVWLHVIVWQEMMGWLWELTGCAVDNEEMASLLPANKASQHSSCMTLNGQSSAEWFFCWFTLANCCAKRVEVKGQLRIESRRLQWVGLREGPYSLTWLSHLASFHTVSPPSGHCHMAFLCRVVRVLV